MKLLIINIELFLSNSAYQLCYEDKYNVDTLLKFKKRKSER